MATKKKATRRLTPRRLADISETAWRDYAKQTNDLRAYVDLFPRQREQWNRVIRTSIRAWEKST